MNRDSFEPLSSNASAGEPQALTVREPFAFDHALFDPAESQRLRAFVHERVFEQAPSEAVCIGRYRVLQRLGSGAMGVVYAAYDEELDRRVAVKLLRHVALDDESADERLLREAKALARLSHPNVVQVHDVGRWEGRVFVAMEFVRGCTLRQWLEAEPRSVDAILQMFEAVGRGLCAAHAAGVIHRDFKPDNVVVSDDGRPRVLDFGLAAPGGEWSETDLFSTAEGRVDPDRTATQTGLVIGTPAYMAPEQFAGSSVDERADQFAFAVALWEALHGERPFQGRTYQELRQAVLEARIQTPTNARRALRVTMCLQRALALETEHRYPSLDNLLEDLRVASRPKRKGRIVAAALVVALGGGGWVLGVGHASSEQDDRLEAQRQEDAAQAQRRQDDAVWLAEARGWIERDPTQAVATLLQLSDEGWEAPEAVEILAEAESRGVASRVIEIPSDARLGRAVVGGWMGEEEIWEPLPGSRTVLDGKRTIVVSPNANAVWSVAGQEDGPVRLLRWRPGEGTSEEATFDEPPQIVVPAADGSAVAVVHRDHWEVWRSGLRMLVAPRHRGDESQAVALSADGTHLAFLAPEGKLRVRALETGQERLVGSKVETVQFSPTGGYIATIEHGLPTIRSADEPREVAWQAAAGPEYERLLFSPDGRYVAAVAKQVQDAPGFELWKVEDGERVRLPPGNVDGGTPLWLAFSLDGRCLLAQRSDNTTRVWAVDEARTFTTSEPRSFDATFSAQGCTLLTKHRRVVRTWEPFADPPPLLGPSTLVTDVASAGPGRWIALYQDHTVLVWDQGRIIHRAEGRANGLTPSRGVAGAEDGTVAWRTAGALEVLRKEGGKLRFESGSSWPPFALTDSGDRIAWVDAPDRWWEVDLEQADPRPIEHRAEGTALGRGQLLYQGEDVLWFVPFFDNDKWHSWERATDVVQPLEVAHQSLWRLSIRDGRFVGLRTQLERHRIELDVRSSPSGPSLLREVDSSVAPVVIDTGEVAYGCGTAVCAWSMDTDRVRVLFRLPSSRPWVVESGPDGILAVGDSLGRLWIVPVEPRRDASAAREHAATLTDLRVLSG